MSLVRGIVLLALLASAPSRASVLTFERNTFDVGGNDHLLVSPDGGTLYADTVRDGLLGGPAMAAYARDADGEIARIQTVFEGEEFGKDSLCGTGQMAVTPDGRHLYVATNCAQAIRPFLREPTGKLIALPAIEHVEGRIDALNLASAIAISPDGADVYVANDIGEVATFRRDPFSGALAHRAGTVIGKPPSSIKALVMSPDGTSLYAAQDPLDLGDAAIHVFRREPSTGELALLESKMDGADGFVSLTRFSSLAISPDGRTVYAGQVYDEPVIVSFERQATGALRATSADVGSAESSSQSFAIAGDGRIVLVGGAGGLRVFERTPSDGRLALVETLTSVNAGFGACGVRTSVAIDPSDTHVYVGSTDCGILTFRRTCGDGTIDPGEACDDGNRNDGDGCDALCRVEPCFTCSGTPSECAPDDGIPCDDANPCTIGTRCLAGVCDGGTPVDDGAPCDDGDACTGRDRCVGGTCRAGSAVVCGLCEACDHRFGCIGALRAGCSKSTLYQSADGSIDLRMRARTRQVTWRWAGVDYATAPLGDPMATTDYTFCVVDTLVGAASGGRRGRVVAAARVPAGSTCGRHACWHGRRRSGVEYRDDAGRNDGVRRVVVQPMPKHMAQVTFLARSRDDLVRGLPITSLVTAQLANEAGGCWSTTYRDYGTNTSRRFRADAGCDYCNDR